MAKNRKVGSVKRFGARYGRKLKQVFGKIEQEQRKKHKCPYCHKVAVKRLEAGIWQCKKCNAKFTGKAYTIAKEHKNVKIAAETPEEEIKEEEE